MPETHCAHCGYEPDSCDCEWRGLARAELLRLLRVSRRLLRAANKNLTAHESTD